MANAKSTRAKGAHGWFAWLLCVSAAAGASPLSFAQAADAGVAPAVRASAAAPQGPAATSHAGRGVDQTPAGAPGTVNPGGATPVAPAGPAGGTPQPVPPVLTSSSSADYLCAFATAHKDKDRKTDAEAALALPFAGFCNEEHHAVLVPDEGDVVVVVPAAAYYKARDAKGSKPWVLMLDGKSVAESAVLDAEIPRGDEVLVRFRITSGSSADSQTFWSEAYQRSGFKRYEPLYIELGWADIPHYFRPPLVPTKPAQANSSGSLVVAGDNVVGMAAVLGALFAGFFLWAMGGTDIFRVGPRPDQMTRRLGYSFARVQWGVWNCFAVTAALYLWVVFGSFPDLTGSVLQLAAVSTLTATVSFFMDSNVQPVPQASQGLIRDLLSGNNNDLQAHRFQALMVNVLLLVAGIVLVARRLAYPDFPGNWLAMLGISNAASLAGKQFLENRPSTAATAPANAGGAATPAIAAGRSV